MQVWTKLDPEKKNFQGGSVIIGNFDGLHLGHQSLLQKAQQTGGPVVVITFDPHPLKVLQPTRAPLTLFPRQDLKEQLAKWSIDLLFIIPFTAELARTSAADFWRECVAEPFKPKHVIAGYDFGFGRSREGSLDMLKEWCDKERAALHVLPPLIIEGSPVSSRRIRDLILKGQVGAATKLLGRPFYLRGQVVSGAGRGKTLGFPTMNLQPENEIVPAGGVYATRTRLANQSFKSVTNIGINPTFTEKGPVKIETHVIGEAVEAAGARLDVDFFERLRPEMKFNSIEDLKKQIQSDILKADETLDLDQRKS